MFAPSRRGPAQRRATPARRDATHLSKESDDLDHRTPARSPMPPRSSCAAAPCSRWTTAAPSCSGADVLVVGETIAAVGPNLAVPEGTVEIDATGGIVMPGMIDTHRHMWQTAMRGYGADWTLTQYFVWYYLEWGKSFRPQDVYAGNLLSAIEARRRRRHDVGRLVARPAEHRARRGRARRARGDPGPLRAGLRQHPAGPVGVVELPRVPRLRAPSDRHLRRPHRPAAGLRRHRRPRRSRSAPRSRRRASSACTSRRTPACGAITNDESIKLMYENGFMTPGQIYVHSTTLSPDSYHKIAASGGYASVSTESECSAGQGYPPTWQLRKYGIPVSLSMDTSVWWSADLFSAMRGTLNADRVRVHMDGARERARPSSTTRCAPRRWWSGPRSAARGARPRRQGRAASRSASRRTSC